MGKEPERIHQIRPQYGKNEHPERPLFGVQHEVEEVEAGRCAAEVVEIRPVDADAEGDQEVEPAHDDAGFDPRESAFFGELFESAVDLGRSFSLAVRNLVCSVN